ncbi:MAG TPA: polymer-forming cytoskeletal protein [Pyrinomonadaceae bacterium]|nr:polymer-forming cytoskeletal protein [Pyrinomonadaceae bacterium]
MLRMGKSPKPEANERDKFQQPNPRPQPAFAAPPQPTPQQAQPQTPTTPEPERPAPSSSRAVTESEALARDIREGIMSGFVGGSTVLSGEANFKGMLRIDGRLNGNITSDKGTLIVSAGGHVEANISVAAAKINGTVNGDIVATERIEFGRTARVRGNIQTPALVVEEGALFEGGCRMTSKQPAQEKPRPAAATPQAKPAAPEKPSAVATPPPANTKAAGVAEAAG